jgi:intraflagellar transport protein 80
MTGDYMDSVCRLESNATDMDWFPIMRKSSRGGATVDLFVIGCVNGTFRFVSASGRLEAPRKAHTGAVTCVRWNHEGSALLTTGEDGSLKIWSRNGQLRSKLVEEGEITDSLPSLPSFFSQHIF